MRRVFLLAALTLAGAVACGPEVPDDNPSCCLYQCDGPRETWFAEYFGTEASCTELASSRCEADFPENPGLARIEYEGGIELADPPNLHEICAARFEAFRTATSTAN